MSCLVGPPTPDDEEPGAAHEQHGGARAGRCGRRDQYTSRTYRFSLANRFIYAADSLSLSPP